MPSPAVALCMIEADCALSPASLGTAAVIGVAGDCQGAPEWTCESRGLVSCQVVDLVIEHAENVFFTGQIIQHPGSRFFFVEIQIRVPCLICFVIFYCSNKFVIPHNKYKFVLGPGPWPGPA